MDTVLLVLGLLFMIGGILGSFLPVVPGLTLSWIGLLLLYCTETVPMNYWVMGFALLLVIIITILEYVIPAKGTKKYGGSSYGVWGTNIGLIVGIFAPIPFGFIIGPFVGAFVGELIYDSKDHKRAFKAATGSFVGFLASTFLNFMLCVVFLRWFIHVVWENWNGLF